MESLSKMFFWLFQKRAVPYWCIIVADCVMYMLSAVVTYATSYGTVYTINHFWPVLGTLAFYLIFYVIGFRLFRTYSGVIRYSSFTDLQRVAAAVLFGLACSVLVRNVFGLNHVLMPVRMRDICVWSVSTLVFMWGLRVLVKVLYDTTFRSRNARKIYIYGVREGGVSIAKSIRNQSPAQFVLAGFLSDQHDMDGKLLMGVDVHGIGPDTAKKMKEAGVEALFVSPLKSESLRENDKLVSDLIDNGIKIYMVPAEQEWDGKSNLSHTALREIDIEDLLPRKKIEVDMDAIGKLLRGKRILITGAHAALSARRW